MSEDFAFKIRTEGKTRDVSELPIGEVASPTVAQLIIPECCREGWASCPHVAKKIKPAKRNVGL